MARVLRLRKAAAATWQEAMQQYLWFKQAQGLRDITIKGHRDVIGLFFRRHPDAWTGELLESVYSFMGERIKPATYNIRRNYLRQFFDWCVKEGVFTDNSLDGFKKRKDDGRMTCLDIDTVRRLIALPDRTSFAGLRDYALLCFVLDTGARPGEAFSLKPDDFNLRALEARIPPGVAKTGVSRTLPLSPITAQAVRTLMSSRHPSWDSSVPVFCSAEGTPLRNDTWGDRLEKYAKELGVKFHPYALRHTFATQFLRAGGNALALQRLMGHSTLEMTKRYVHLTEGDVRKEHSKASPLIMVKQEGCRMRGL
ncbi:MAG: phage integrase family protein [Firmicutes bacterium]|nr:phage integrase family protein [Bacillota bacterium]